MTVGATLVVASAVACVTSYGFVRHTRPNTASVTIGRQVQLTVATSATASGLYPGKVTTAHISINNPNGFAVVVTQLSAGSSPSFTNTSNGLTCAAGVVTTDAASAATGLAQVGTTTTTTRIAAGASGAYSVTVRMAATQVGNGCAGTSFTIPIRATALAVS